MGRGEILRMLSTEYIVDKVHRWYLCVRQVTTVPDEGENSFKMPRASVVHMTSTATRPQHMSQVGTLFDYGIIWNRKFRLSPWSAVGESLTEGKLKFSGKLG